MKDRTTHKPRVWICFYARCHRCACLSVFFLLPPLVPLRISLLSLPFLKLIILRPFLPLPFCQRKTSPLPQGVGCLLSMPLFFFFFVYLVPHWSTEEIGQKKKVNIWTAAKDGRGVASLASVSVMSRPERPPPARTERDRSRHIQSWQTEKIVQPFWCLLHGNQSGNIS